MLYLRVISALIGIPLVLVSVYYGGPWYALLIAVFVNLGLYEYNTILKKRDYTTPFFFNHLGATLLLIIIYFEQLQLVYPLLMLVFFLLFVTVLFDMEKISSADAALSLWGMLYLGGLAGFLLMLRLMPGGASYTYILLIGVWIHDTAAYFTGVKWGIRKFAPQISPKKSVEGSLAGIGAAVVVFFSVAILFPDLTGLSPLQATILALGIAVFAQLGDLLESALKRQMNVKDSGGLIPGHGGVLDRLDSLLLAGPFVYYYFQLVNIM